MRGAVGSRCEESDIAGGDLPMESIAATRERSTALSELRRLESSSSDRALLLRSSKLGALLRSQGPLVSGYGPGAGGGTLQLQAHWQSLRAFSSGPPEQPDSKMDSPDSNGRRVLPPGQKVFMGGLLKPSDVSGGECIGLRSMQPLKMAMQ